MISTPLIFFFFFFNDTATTEIYTLSLHDALPISHAGDRLRAQVFFFQVTVRHLLLLPGLHFPLERSEEHTSELQSRLHLVCRLLLEKKKKTQSLGELLFLLTDRSGKYY